jgi:hypothetical protein
MRNVEAPFKMLLAGLPAGQKEHGQETMPSFDPDFLASR